LVPDRGAIEESLAVAVYPELHDRVHLGCPDTAECDGAARVCENGVGGGGEFRASVSDQSQAQVGGSASVRGVGLALAPVRSQFVSGRRGVGEICTPGCIGG
jgi:hypothetical protein